LQRAAERIAVEHLGPLVTEATGDVLSIRFARLRVVGHAAGKAGFALAFLSCLMLRLTRISLTECLLAVPMMPP
jgi:hypothetical protein